MHDAHFAEPVVVMDEDASCGKNSSSFSCGQFDQIFAEQLRNPAVVTNSLDQCRSSKAYCTDVAIVGNGPSAMSLSCMLAGHWPYYDPKEPHPDQWLHERLTAGQEDWSSPDAASLLQLDLATLSEGLEGRSGNAVALLVDSLMRPNAELGEANPSTLQWRNDRGSVMVPHVVLGSGLPGGSWQEFEANSLTVSYGNWMELPGYSLDDFIASKETKCDETLLPTTSSGQSNKLSARRVPCSLIQQYYSDYIGRMKLTDHYFNWCTVTKARRRRHLSEAPEDQAEDGATPERDAYVWEVSGFHPLGPFTFFAKKLVLATGTTIPRCLEVPGESCLSLMPCKFCDVGCFPNYQNNNNQYEPLSITEPNANQIQTTHGVELEPKVLHSLSQLEKIIARINIERENENNSTMPSATTSSSDVVPGRVLVVGSGLTAADAVLQLLSNEIPVTHVFRPNPNDPQNIMSRLTAEVYPEYSAVAELMRERKVLPNELYRPFPASSVLSFSHLSRLLLNNEMTSSSRDIINASDESSTTLLHNPNDLEVRCHCRALDGYDFVVRVRYAVVLIGFEADLGFLGDRGVSLTENPHRACDAKHNRIVVDMCSGQAFGAESLYAVGPLIGDNFVRFLVGGAVAVASGLLRDLGHVTTSCDDLSIKLN